MMTPQWSAETTAVRHGRWLSTRKILETEGIEATPERISAIIATTTGEQYSLDDLQREVMLRDIDEAVVLPEPVELYYMDNRGHTLESVGSKTIKRELGRLSMEEHEHWRKVKTRYNALVTRKLRAAMREAVRRMDMDQAVCASYRASLHNDWLGTENEGSD